MTIFSPTPIDPFSIYGDTSQASNISINTATTAPDIFTGDLGLPDLYPIDDNTNSSVTTLSASGVSPNAARFNTPSDWRVRLSLAPNSNYLYNAPDPGILSPLIATKGVIFPYMPLINVNYTAQYEPAMIVHSNYTMHQYTKSAVEQVQITGEFTAQDTYEANYILAVVHFFRSATKMFYGQDNSPRNGTPPPLCYVHGLGNYQFAAHPVVITGFNYSLMNDVDYIKTTTSHSNNPTSSIVVNNRSRNLPSGIEVGGVKSSATFNQSTQENTTSYVPTKIQLAISCLPIVSRAHVSNKFSLSKYASGELLNGNNSGGGMW